MPLHWTDMVLRLTLTVLARILIGYNRSEHGKAVGMRTTLLVCLAASVAMLQVNLLLPMAGRPPNSFVMNDLMRLPLGILTGVGFIGGGAILRRDDIVVGVTTAATLWLVTVIGLCLGGGQLVLGTVATLLGLLALWVLKWAEDKLRRERSSRFMIEVDASGPAETEIRRRLRNNDLSIWQSECVIDAVIGRRQLIFSVHEIRRRADTTTPAVIDELVREPGVVASHGWWKFEGGVIS
jgi:putative Mg2+ transporter-C (MgtC) family protein